MDYNVCNECSTVNEPEYIYCKNCGAPLREKNSEKSEYGKKSNFTHNNTDYNNFNTGFNGQQDNNGFQNEYIVDNIEGIPMDEVALFVGKNGYNICRKFSKLEITGSKASWCWPVAILGYFLGPLGAAIWFLYRKMYKVAAILIAVGVLFSFINTVLTFDTVSKTANSLLQSFENYEDFSFTEQIEILEDIEKNSETPKQWFAEAIQNTLELITAAITGIFAFYWYKKHTVRVLKKYKERNIDLRYYRMGVLTLGGTSGGFAFLGVALILVLNFIISFAVMIISFI